MDKYIFNDKLIYERINAVELVVYSPEKNLTCLLNKSATTFFLLCDQGKENVLSSEELIKQYVLKYKHQSVSAEKLFSDAADLINKFIEQGFISEYEEEKKWQS